MSRSNLPFCAILPLGLVAAGLAGLSAKAQTLPESAQMMGQETAELQESLIATGPWTAAEGLPGLRVVGAVSTQSWSIPGGGLTTLQLLTTWQAELQKEGFDIGFGCAAADCGGFDFRFAIPTLPEPDMHVDLGDFRYLAAQRPAPGGTEHRVILISRGPQSLYAQITTILPASVPARQVMLGAADTPAALVDPAQASPNPAPTAPTSGADVVALLLSQGNTALDDLIFATGTSELDAGEYASLLQLGAWLLANPERTVALVGHTDATGGLAGNVALSKRRAESVRRWLLDRFGLPAQQILAEGVGYLAPRAPNDTPEGQAKNRRVEVMLTSTR